MLELFSGIRCGPSGYSMSIWKEYVLYFVLGWKLYKHWVYQLVLVLFNLLQEVKILTRGRVALYPGLPAGTISHYTCCLGVIVEYLLSLSEVIRYAIILTKDPGGRWSNERLLLSPQVNSRLVWMAERILAKFRPCATKRVYCLTLAGWNLGQLISDCLNKGFPALISQNTEGN